VCGEPGPAQRYLITRFRVLQCPRCTQVFLDPLPSAEEIRAMFEELYTTGGGSVPELKDYYDFCYEDEPVNPLVQQYEEYLGYVEARRGPGRLLDIGCGTGLFLSVARRRGWAVHGIDESLEATRHARDHFGLDPWVGDFEDFAAREEGFDLITGWDIIEHARDPVSLLAAVRRCLAPGGLVALSTPNQRSILDLVAGSLYRVSAGRITWPLEKFYIEQHFLYFTPDTLERALVRSGLELVELRREITDLRRLHFGPGMRLVVTALLESSRWLGLENRLFCIARAAAGAPGAATADR